MADTSLTRAYNALLTTTLDQMRPRMINNISKANVVTAVLHDSGRRKLVDGGVKIKRELMYGLNTTFKSYSGYDIIDTTPQEGITAAFYDWSEIAGTISISRKEMRQNSGRAQILNLLQAKTKQAMLSMRETLNKQLISGTISGSTFIQGNNSKDLIPLPMLIPLDPTSGTVGSIDRSAESWWQSKATASTATTRSGLKAELYKMFHDVQKGDGNLKPDLILADQVTFETYELALDENQRYTSGKIADMGFENIRLKSAVIVWDEMVPDIETPANQDTGTFTVGNAFFLNSEFIELTVDRESDMVTTPFLENQQQTAISAKLLFMGQLTMDNCRKHGVLYSISQSIVS